MITKSILLKEFGGVASTARALMVSQPTASNWPEELPWSVVGRIAILQPAFFERWKAENPHLLPTRTKEVA